jgi:hypothetical protein
MMNQIIAAIKQEQNAGADKVRVTLITWVEHKGRKIPQVVYMMEFYPSAALLKSGKLAAPFRKAIEGNAGQYETFEVSTLTKVRDDEDGAFERS